MAANWILRFDSVRDRDEFHTTVRGIFPRMKSAFGDFLPDLLLFDVKEEELKEIRGLECWKPKAILPNEAHDLFPPTDKRVDTLVHRLQCVIRDTLDVDPRKITSDARFVEDLGCDSLGQIELLMAVEEHFDLDIDDNTVKDIKTFGEAVAYMRQRLGLPNPEFPPTQHFILRYTGHGDIPASDLEMIKERTIILDQGKRMLLVDGEEKVLRRLVGYSLTQWAWVLTAEVDLVQNIRNIYKTSGLGS